MHPTKPMPCRNNFLIRQSRRRKKNRVKEKRWLRRLLPKKESKRRNLLMIGRYLIYSFLSFAPNIDFDKDVNLFPKITSFLGTRGTLRFFRHTFSVFAFGKRRTISAVWRSNIRQWRFLTFSALANQTEFALGYVAARSSFFAFACRCAAGFDGNLIW